MTVRDPATALLAERLIQLGMADPVIEELAPFEAEWTLVVPVRDRPAQLDRLLESVENGRAIVVVDDASRRPGLIADVAARHGARLITLTENVGPGAARNAGLATVTTPYVVFADSDIVLSPDTVPVLLKHFWDPKVAMAVPRIAGLATDSSDNWIGRYEKSKSSLDLGDRPAAVRPRSPVSWASTACVVAKVDALGSAFDEALRIGEDVDLGWRIVDAGWRIRYEPAIEAWHEHRTRFWDWWSRKAVYGTAASPLGARHPDAIAPAIFAPWSAAVIIALVAQRRWSVPVALGIAGLTAVRISRRLGRVEHSLTWASWLTGNGALAALSQTSALLLRHWWPLTVMGMFASRRVRRAVAVAAIADVVVDYVRPGTIDLDPVRYGIARRLDDLAYGAGVWFAAIRARSFVSLMPRLTTGSGRADNRASSQTSE